MGKKHWTQKLKEELELYKNEAKQWREKYLTVLAELDNFRRQVDKERDRTRRVAQEKMMLAIIPVLDNLEQALHYVKNANNLDSLKKGVEMIYSQLKHTLEELGLRCYTSVGEKFDPERHEALFIEETDDHPEGTIIKELAQGYTFKGRVIRPARVVVAKPKNKKVNE